MDYLNNSDYQLFIVNRKDNSKIPLKGSAVNLLVITEIMFFFVRFGKMS